LGGCGAYVSGTININHLNSLYIYVGQSGYNPDFSKSNKSPMTFNGGGQVIHLDTHWQDAEVGTCGGGATDIRLTNGDWDSFNSLKSRIMVSGGGGGPGAWGERGGDAGGLTGIASTHMINYGYEVTPGSQTSGFEFGKGEDGNHRFSNQNAGGGGGGYYGGREYKGERLKFSNGSYMEDYGGGGGSSFISGHSGCKAITSSSTSTSITHSSSANHYSGKVFTNTVMKAGNESMPSPTGGTETGHSGNGYCLITWMPVL
jgi:hypothetical protein